MKNALSICGIALALLAPSSMFADTIFSFSFGAGGFIKGVPNIAFSGSGQLNTETTGTPGVFQIVGVSGTIDYSLSFYPYSHPITTANGLVDVSQIDGSLSTTGIDFLLSNGVSADVFPGTLFQFPGQYLATLNGFDNGISISEVAPAGIVIAAMPSVAATPEPGTFVLLGTGMLVMAGAVRRNPLD